MQLKNGLVVLGLATSHNEEMKQVRGVDQTPYLVNCMELRWQQPCSDPVAPCMKKENHEP